MRRSAGQPASWLVVLAVLVLPAIAGATSPKVVLAEDFTATWCGDCPNARCALEIMLDEFGDQLVVAEHHIYDILDTDWTNARRSVYGVGPIPHVRFDGKYYVAGAPSCSQAAAAYRAVIQQRLAETGGVSPLEIHGDWWCDDLEVHLRATFRLQGAAQLPGVEAYLLVLEDDITWQGATYHHVTRAAYSTPVVLTQVGDSASVAADFALGRAWEIEHLQAIAFLQRTSGDHEVYQSARLAQASDIILTWARPCIGLPGGNSTANFHGTLVNTAATADAVTLSLENTFGWAAEFCVAPDSIYGTQPVFRELAPAETLGVDLRVTTDADVRVGGGCLMAESAGAGTVRRSLARVFNGSPALLLVDDDLTDLDEAPVIAALAARGYLHDLWNVYVEHLDNTPDFGDIHGYDAVIWHQGWCQWGVSMAEAAAGLTEYLDGGGRLVLSSQDYLSTTGVSAFARDYLGVAGWTEDVGAQEIAGVGKDPIGDSLSFVLDYPYPEYDRADRLVPNDIGASILLSEDEDPVALRADNGIGRTVFFACALNAMDEGAPDPNNLATLLERTIRWLIPMVGTDVREEPHFASGSRILSLAPNPFILAAAPRGATLRLLLSAADAAAPVRVDVCDVNGRRVRKLIESALAPGRRDVIWDGCGDSGRRLEGGVYSIRLVTAGSQCAARAVLLP